MVTGSFEPALLRFGLFELDPKSGELRKAGVEINLPPQPAKVLVLLARRAGQLVTREELREQIWGKETFVDFEHGLNSCIKQIRATLDDHAGNPTQYLLVPAGGDALPTRGCKGLPMHLEEYAIVLRREVP